MEPEEFFELVQTVRERRDPGSYNHDTLIEAIAEELERELRLHLHLATTA